MGFSYKRRRKLRFKCTCIRRRQWHPTPALLPGKSHGRRSLVGCSPWGRKESDTTERLPFHFSLSCIGEGNGNPLQCFCLENPRDGGAWWVAVYGVTQSRTRLKRLSSSSICIILKSSGLPELCLLFSNILTFWWICPGGSVRAHLLFAQFSEVTLIAFLPCLA